MTRSPAFTGTKAHPQLLGLAELADQARDRLRSVTRALRIGSRLFHSDYDGNGRLLSAVDSFGNSVTVTHNSQNDIGSIAVSGGGTVQYAYTGFELTGVTNLDSTTKTYVYGNTTFLNALTSIIVVRPGGNQSTLAWLRQTAFGRHGRQFPQADRTAEPDSRDRD